MKERASDQPGTNTCKGTSGNYLNIAMSDRKNTMTTFSRLCNQPQNLRSSKTEHHQTPSLQLSSPLELSTETDIDHKTASQPAGTK